MFHLITGNLNNYENQLYISNDLLGIQATYHGKQSQWTYFLYPIMDEHTKTIKYYAFDSASQKESFSSVLKISGIWPKIAYEISWIDAAKLMQAIDTFDLVFFQSIPGIGPKTAKKVLVEIKSSFSDKDLIKINADDKLVKNIVKTLGTMGYDKTKVLTKLSTYDGVISQDTLAWVMQWLIENLK